MKRWDLNSGCAKLDQALKSLHAACREIGTQWDDATYHRFLDTYVAPLEPRVKNLVNAARRLAEVLNTAERQCGDE
jgi:hypothetical protein